MFRCFYLVSREFFRAHPIIFYSIFPHFLPVHDWAVAQPSIDLALARMLTLNDRGGLKFWVCCNFNGISAQKELTLFGQLMKCIGGIKIEGNRAAPSEDGGMKIVVKPQISAGC